MSNITTHVLDTSTGRPVEGMNIWLSRQTDSGWEELGYGATDADGRQRTLLPAGTRLTRGGYRLIFDTRTKFYPSVAIHFTVDDSSDDYHVPLLLSPYGYSTYRGS